MQITKITLIYFLDNSYANIFQKHLGAVKIKVNIFIDIFEVKDPPLFMGFVVNWWWQTFYFKPPQGLLNILTQKLSKNWVRVNRAVEKCAKLLF